MRIVSPDYCHRQALSIELSDLTFAVATVNLWNRLNVSFRTPPGSADALLGLTKAGLT